MISVVSMFVFATAGQARPKMQTVTYAINLHWCGHIKRSCYSGRQALAIAACETGRTFDIWASNGQYKGLFQMGSSERRIFGHGWNAWDQARAAHRYYVRSGKDWSPWSCRYVL
jgi:hypothetical protein